MQADIDSSDSYVNHTWTLQTIGYYTKVDCKTKVNFLWYFHDSNNAGFILIGGLFLLVLWNTCKRNAFAIVPSSQNYTHWRTLSLRSLSKHQWGPANYSSLANLAWSPVSSQNQKIFYVVVSIIILYTHHEYWWEGQLLALKFYPSPPIR